jgi:[glutamine synthetase] adenylyltransferase / [glutamine synthetase]-adenylyl-L-tyrosine phosphorylase
MTVGFCHSGQLFLTTAARIGRAMNDELEIIRESSGYLAALLRRPENVDWLWHQKNLYRRYPLTELYEDVQQSMRDCDSFASLQQAIRRCKQRHFLRIGGRDLLGRADLQEITGQLSDLAAVVIQVGLELLWQHPEWWAREHDPAVLASWRDEFPLAVLGLGKLGGHELNYSSDVDLLFLHPGSAKGKEQPQEVLAVLNRLCQWLTQFLADNVDGDRVFQVDLRLRPQGKDGELVPSVAAAAYHYLLHGHPWERQMLLKARPVAGDRPLGNAFLREVRPFVFRRFLDFQALDELREMRDRILREAVRPGKGWYQFDVKLGVGGIREVEFLVQSFQMVYGGRHPDLDEPNTLRCLDRLEKLALLPSQAVAELWEAYIFLRRVEHWVQLDQNRQTQRLPQNEESLRRLAVALGMEGQIERFLERLADTCATVHRHFTGLFQADGERSRSDAREVTDGLENARGNWADVRRELAEQFHSEAWQRLLGVVAPFAPVVEEAVLGVLSRYHEVSGHRGTSLERVLVRLERYFSNARRRPGLTKLLNSSTDWITAICLGLAESDLVADLLSQQPSLAEGLATAGAEALTPGHWKKTSEKILASVGDFESAMEWIRRLKNERLLQVAVADLKGDFTQEQAEEALSELADFVLQHTYHWVREERALPEDLPLAVVGLGSLGSQEMNYLSDLDLVFVYRTPESDDTGQIPLEVVRFIQRLMRMVSTPLGEGPGYAVDVRLRPTGNYGPLVVTQESWENYYSKQADLWEIQALLRARAIVGPPGLCRWLEWTASQICYQQRESTTVWSRLCHLRQRMQLERCEERADLVDVKLGFGGLADVEFLVQGHQLLFGYEHQGLRTRSLRTALQSLASNATEGGLLFPELVSPFRALRALERRLQLSTNLSAATITPVQLESMMTVGIWPPGQRDHGILTWEDLQATRRKIRQVFRQWCANL